MKKVFLSILLTILPILASAETVEIDGIWYNLLPKINEAEVTKNPNDDFYKGSYSGRVEIPADVTYNEVKYSVTTIGYDAFSWCTKLTSVIIPQSVTSIKEGAFGYCTILSTISIPNSVNSIEETVFSGCTSLTSINIPNSVTSIGGHAFSGCTSLTSVNIPNSVTSIGGHAFEECTQLTSITIPNSVTSIGEMVFRECSNLHTITISNNLNTITESSFNGCNALTSIIIPNSVTSICEAAFAGCYSLTSIIIPQSVTSIDEGAFNACRGLISATIGSNIKNIEERAFANCDKMTDVYCMAEKVTIDMSRNNEGLYTHPDAFQDSYPQTMTLHVPAASIEAYRSTEPWSQFKAIVALEGGDNPEIKKCATPEISYANGKVSLSCETESVDFISEVTVADAKNYYDSEFSLSQTYIITTYATKVGYENSDIATATLCWIDVEPKTEGITNIVSNVRARAVLIQSNGNQLIISGADEGTAINVFDMSGRPAGSAKVSAEITTLNTSLHSGDIGIVKIGEKSIKVLIK